MKRILSILTLLCISLSICAHDFMVNGIAYNIIGDNEVEVTNIRGGDKYEGNITIQDRIKYKEKEYNVTKIGNRAFYYCEYLISVTIPNSVTSISDWAFAGCRGLTSVTIPNSVTFIGYNAFYECSGLTSVTIPNSVTSIGNNAFSYCSGLTSVTIPNSVTSIGNGAFSYCRGLTSVTIPNSVTSIGSGAFSGCSGMTSVTIPYSVTSIGNNAFYNCSGLTSVTIPNSVTSIGNRAFKGCSGLTSVTIPNSVTSIGSEAFQECSGMTSVTILCPSVGSWFSGLSSIKEVELGNQVTSIGDKAFMGCDLRIIKSMADTPPSLSTEINAYILEVPYGCIDKYIHTDYWNNIESIYAINNGNKYVGIQLEEEGESIAQFANSSNSFFEVNVNEMVEVKAKNDLTHLNCVLFHGNKDVSDVFCQNGCYSFQPSAESYRNNLIKTHTYPKKDVNVSTAGTLLDLIGIENVEHITSLTVSGNLT